jgi:hypothetical protein
MKKLLLAISAVFAISFANAQCTPDAQFTSPGIYPDSATNMMTAYETVLYSQTITNVVPADTCVVIITGFPCTNLSLDSVVVESLTGLPAGLNFQCDNAECQYPGGQSGCAIISGTPPTGSAGTYPLTIQLSAYVGGLGIPNPFTLDYYFIEVLPAPNSVNEYRNNSFSIKQNNPNPFDEITSIEYSLIESGKVTFEVYNIVGEMVDSKSYNGMKGMNRLQFDGSDLANGAYIYKMTNNGNTITKRMVISR